MISPEKKRNIQVLSIFALVVVFIHSFAHIIRVHELSKTNSNYIPWTQEADFDMFNVHGARLREIRDGSIFEGDIDRYEGKGIPMLWPILSMEVFTPFIYLTDSIWWAIIITDALFPVLIFLLFYAIIFKFTKSRHYALLFSFAVVLFPQMSLLIPPSSFAELKHLLLQFNPLPNLDTNVTSLMFLRREAFIPGAPFFLAFIYATSHVVLSQVKKRSSIILAGLFYGSLFFFYFYFWVYATVLLGILFLVFLVRKEEKIYWSICSIFLTGLVVSIPFWLNVHRISQLPQYHELISRMGKEISHNIQWVMWKTYVLYGSMAAVMLWLGRKLSKLKVSSFVFSLLIAEIIVPNIQVLTGFNVQSDHWGNRVFVLIQVIVLATLIFYLFEYLMRRYATLAQTVRSRRFATVVYVLLAFLTINVGTTIFLHEKEFASSYTLSAADQNLYVWLNNNTEKDTVILTPLLETNVDIPVYTHNNIYLARTQTSVASEEELLTRLYTAYKLFGIPASYLDSLLDHQNTVVYFFTVKYNEPNLDRYLRPQNYDGIKLPQEVRERVVRDYDEFTMPNALPYRADYALIKEGIMNLDLSPLQDCKILYHGAPYLVYDISSGCVNLQ